MNDEGILLVAHGTRSLRGQAEFFEVARLVGDRCSGVLVQPCFLEFAEPDIAQGIAGLVREGRKQVCVVPVLLFAAGHAKRDIPGQVKAACEGRQLNARFADVLGCHSKLIGLSAQRCQEVVKKHPGPPPEETAIVLVGRGSNDESAVWDTIRYADLLKQQVAAAEVAAGFFAMASPPVREVLGEMADRYRRVVVLPHLLFAGEIQKMISELVAEYGATYPNTDWVVADHLGPANAVVDAVVERWSRG
jgi:sirohydrochlorin cobaltochelatase